MTKHLSHRIVLAVIVSATGWAPWAKGSDLPSAPLALVESPALQHKPLVQLAILLDTSGSMSGLIDQARTELWSIVNQFILARQKGVAPEVQVALFEYGNNGLAQEKGYIRQIVPFTTDLDRVSQELFALRTNGGSEYCGWVIKDAVERLQWTTDPNGLKVLFIAGNEPFTQGPIDYRQACKAAIEKGIVVNTLHCGTEAEGMNGQWDNGARLADGRYLTIDHNRQVVYIAAPQDEPIATLNVKLNETYVAFGTQGSTLRERQSAQDSNARMASPEAAAQRAVTKASANYVNADWDLVDAVGHRQVDLEKVRDDQLPQSMQGLPVQEKRAFIQAKSNERSEIQRQIQVLNQQRQQYIAGQRTKQQTNGNTLGLAIVQAVRQQATAKQFEFVDVASLGEHP
jgi:hypothetical protein